MLKKLDTFTCPFCGEILKKGNTHHNCEQKQQFFNDFDFNELKELYVEKEFSILDLSMFYNKKYNNILFSYIPDSFFRKLIKNKFQEYYRGVKESVNTKKKKEKYENTMLEHFGCKHNFEKKCESRKKWEKRLLETEGITNVFQRESVKQKSLKTLLKKYGSIDEINKMRGFYSTKEGFKEKYGDNWETEWNKFTDNKRTQTQDFYKRKYGQEWEEKWNEHLEKVKNCRMGVYNNGLNVKAYEILNKYNIYFIPEFPLENNYKKIIKNNIFYYDLKIKNLIIELNGTYWHCNPKKYKKNDIVKFPNNTFKKVKDIWEKDEYKIKNAQDNGFNVETIWEDELNEETLLNILKKYNLWKK